MSTHANKTGKITILGSGRRQSHGGALVRAGSR